MERHHPMACTMSYSMCHPVGHTIQQLSAPQDAPWVHHRMSHAMHRGSVHSIDCLVGNPVVHTTVYTMAQMLFYQAFRKHHSILHGEPRVEGWNTVLPWYTPWGVPLMGHGMAQGMHHGIPAFPPWKYTWDISRDVQYRESIWPM